MIHPLIYHPLIHCDPSIDLFCCLLFHCFFDPFLIGACPAVVLLCGVGTVFANIASGSRGWWWGWGGVGGLEGGGACRVFMCGCVGGGAGGQCKAGACVQVVGGACRKVGSNGCMHAGCEGA